MLANAADRYWYRMQVERQSGWGKHGEVKVLVKDGKPVNRGERETG